MKTLKEFLEESAQVSESWRRDENGLVSPDEESQKLEIVPPAAKPPKEGKRVLLVPRKKVKEYPPGKPVIGWKNKK